MKKLLSIIILLVVSGGIYLYWQDHNAGLAEVRGSGNLSANKYKAVVYKSPACGCCGTYVSYLKKQGFDVEVINTTDMSPIKSEYGVPENMLSCHTALIDNYFIEGHIPVEAINKLLKEKPVLRGIAMPGMPSGSPGMTGAKRGPFDVYSVDAEGNISLFTSL